MILCAGVSIGVKVSESVILMFVMARAQFGGNHHKTSVYAASPTSHSSCLATWK